MLAQVVQQTLISSFQFVSAKVIDGAIIKSESDFWFGVLFSVSLRFRLGREQQTTNG